MQSDMFNGTSANNAIINNKIINTSNAYANSHNLVDDSKIT